MIYKNHLSLAARYYGGKAISSVHYGTKLVWETVCSCFGSGCWLNDRSWSNLDAWNNG